MAATVRSRPRCRGSGFDALTDGELGERYAVVTFANLIKLENRLTTDQRRPARGRQIEELPAFLGNAAAAPRARTRRVLEGGIGDARAADAGATRKGQALVSEPCMDRATSHSRAAPRTQAALPALRRAAAGHAERLLLLPLPAALGSRRVGATGDRHRRSRSGDLTEQADELPDDV